MSLISILGNVNESIQENYTSEKLFKAADSCLYAALDIIIKNTTLVEECLAIYVTTYTRKQIFNAPNMKYIEKQIFRFFFADVDAKLGILMKMKLNRDLLLLPIKLFADCQTAYCRSVVSGSPVAYDIRKALSARDMKKDLTLEMLHVKTHYTNYVDTRGAIIEKYYRLIVTNIGKISPIIKDKIDLEDAAAEYYAAALKAFAKFDIMSGPFTSYLKGWFKNAKSQVFNDEIGVAYLIPGNIRFKIANGVSDVNNFSVELEKFEDIGVKSDIDMAQESDDDAIRQIVEAFDANGIYRLLNEMEVTSDKR